MSRTLAIAAVIGISIYGGEPPAAELCARRNRVVVRETCGQRETRLDPARLGLVGPRGEVGPVGPPGPTSDLLPTNGTLRGVFAINQDVVAAFPPIITPISFGFRVRGPGEEGGPTPVYVVHGEDRVECPGNFKFPEAAPGYLCVYESYRANVSATMICEHHRFAYGDITACGADQTGAILVITPAAPGRIWLAGSWAATAEPVE